MNPRTWTDSPSDNRTPLLATSACSLSWGQLKTVEPLLCSRMWLTWSCPATGQLVPPHPSPILSPSGSPGWQHPATLQALGHALLHALPWCGFPSPTAAQSPPTAPSGASGTGRGFSPSRHSPAQQSPSPGPHRLCKFCFLPIFLLAEPQTLQHTDFKAQINPSRDSLPAQPEKPLVPLSPRAEGDHSRGWGRGSQGQPASGGTRSRPLLLPTGEGSPSPDLRGKRTCLMKERTPLFSTFPGSQKAFFNFFFTSSLRSRRSIFESWRKRFPQPFTQALAQKRQLVLELLQLLLRPQCERREKSPSLGVQPLRCQPLTRPPAEPLTTATVQGPTSSDELILLPVRPGTIGFIKWTRLA